MLGACHIDKRYGEKIVLRDVSAEFEEGAVTCIMGPSGCGKTTLLRILMGLEQPDAGTVQGFRRGSFAAVFQEERLCEDFSAAANVALAAPRSLSREQIDRCLRELELGESLKQRVRELSGGMRRRVAIARALMAGRPVMLMDEPFKGLDQQTRQRVAQVVRRYAAGKTLLVVTHDPREATLLSGRVLTMKKEG